MLLYAMTRRQYVLAYKVISAYLYSLEEMYKKYGPPKNPYELMREQNVLADIKALQDLLLDLKSRERLM